MYKENEILSMELRLVNSKCAGLSKNSEMVCPIFYVGAGRFEKNRVNTSDKEDVRSGNVTCFLTFK